MAEYDRSSKWLIQHHGDSILRLAGVRDIISWRPLQAELVQPAQLPDGLLEARIAGQAEPASFVLEIATYPEQRLLEQVLRDTALVLLDRRVLPEVLVLVLHPKGTMRAADALTLNSPLGWTQLTAGWRVVELWTVPAEDMLATGEPGIMPWVPLSAFPGAPEPVLQRCRAVIDTVPTREERSNLLAVTQVLTKLRYNDPQLLAVFGGLQAMIESPLIQEIVAEAETRAKAEAKAESIMGVLGARFGTVPHDISAALKGIRDERTLDRLLRDAALCHDLDAFRAQLA